MKKCEQANIPEIKEKQAKAWKLFCKNIVCEFI